MCSLRQKAFEGIGIATLMLVTTSLSFAGCNGKETGCNKQLGCWIWTCSEVQETVYDVEYKEVTKKVKVPYIREIKEPVSCRVCMPIDSQSLRDCPEIDYQRSVDSITVEKCTTTEDECGQCTTSHSTEVQPKTCLTRVEVSRQVPVLEWQSIPKEDKFSKTYFVRDWQDKDEVLRIPVMKARVITRKVWTRTPVPIDGCSSACESAIEVGPTSIEGPKKEVSAEPQIVPDVENK